MKVKVLKDFIDRETSLLNQKGAEIELTNERFKEINSTEHGELVEAIEEPEQEYPEKAVEAEKEAEAKKAAEAEKEAEPKKDAKKKNK